MVDLKRKKLVLAFIYHFVLTMFAGLAVGGNVSKGKEEETEAIDSNVSRYLNLCVIPGLHVCEPRVLPVPAPEHLPAGGGRAHRDDCHREHPRHPPRHHLPHLRQWRLCGQVQVLGQLGPVQLHHGRLQPDRQARHKLPHLPWYSNFVQVIFVCE